MKLPFTKMTAQGNDYIYFDLDNDFISESKIPELAAKFSRRRLDIGADGIVLMDFNQPDHDISMRIFNADGSEAEMCGSALRSVTYYFYRKTGKRECKVMTKAGYRSGKVGSNDNVSVSMGEVKLIERNVLLKDLDIEGMYLNIGNPHFVINTDDIEKDFHLAEKISCHPYFVNGVNVHFMRINSESDITIKIWERGSGITFACGTGACCCAESAHLITKMQEFVTVNQPGGSVLVSYDELTNESILTGDVRIVYEGIVEI